MCILGDEAISKCLYNLFLAVQQIRRATLAGFSETNGVVYAKFRKSIIRITVLYGSYSTVMLLYELYSTLFRFDPPTQSTI